jgi:hypothetical protein
MVAHNWNNDNGTNYSFYCTWSPKVSQRHVVRELSSLDFVFDGDNEVELITRKKAVVPRIPRSERELWKYKSKYWSDGIMHHEDVLYFSYLDICLKIPKYCGLSEINFHTYLLMNSRIRPNSKLGS